MGTQAALLGVGGRTSCLRYGRATLCPHHRQGEREPGCRPISHRPGGRQCLRHKQWSLCTPRPATRPLRRVENSCQCLTSQFQSGQAFLKIKKLKHSCSQLVIAGGAEQVTVEASGVSSGWRSDSRKIQNNSLMPSRPVVTERTASDSPRVGRQL